MPFELSPASHQDDAEARPVEIERKYLVANPPEDLSSWPHKRIVQGYLVIAADGSEVRLRRSGATCLQSVKRGKGLQRTEIEVELTAAQFERLWPATAGRRLEKTRYDMAYGDATIELDVYAGPLEGLVTAEVEFFSVAASEAFEPPGWFGKEVTEDERYRNQHLAVHGLPRDPV